MENELKILLKDIQIQIKDSKRDLEHWNFLSNISHIGRAIGMLEVCVRINKIIKDDAKNKIEEYMISKQKKEIKSK